MRNWSVPAGRLFGVELRVHLSFLLLLGFVYADSVGRSMARAFGVVAIIFVSVLAHEAGHALAALRTGAQARAVVLLPTGGVTLADDADAPNVPRDVRIASAGPLINLLLAVAIAVFVLAFLPKAGLFTRPWITTANLPRTAVWVNLLLALLNMMPAYPLDGGRVLRSVLAARVDILQATRRAVTLSQMFATALILAGFVWTPWFSMIGFFIFVGAQLEDRSALFHAVLENVRMEDVMLTDFRTLSPADTLEAALHAALHTLQDDFPVVRGGDLVGVISKHHIVQALRADGNGYIQPVMNKLFEAAGKDDSLASAFRKITGRGLTMVPVVDGGRLIGIVTLQNLMHSIALVAEARRLQQLQS